MIQFNYDYRVNDSIQFDITMHHDYIKCILCIFIKLYKHATSLIMLINILMFNALIYNYNVNIASKHTSKYKVIMGEKDNYK